MASFGRLKYFNQGVHCLTDNLEVHGLTGLGVQSWCSASAILGFLVQMHVHEVIIFISVDVSFMFVMFIFCAALHFLRPVFQILGIFLKYTDAIYNTEWLAQCSISFPKIMKHVVTASTLYLTLMQCHFEGFRVSVLTKLFTPSMHFKPASLLSPNAWPNAHA